MEEGEGNRRRTGVREDRDVRGGGQREREWRRKVRWQRNEVRQ